MTVNIWQLLNTLTWVPRWALAKSEQQTVAEHTYGVMMITDWILHRLPAHMGGLKAACYEYALKHDAYEGLTADPPNVAKRLHLIIDQTKTNVSPMTGDMDGMLRGRGERHPQIEKIVKFADIIEMVVFLERQIRCGAAHLKELQDDAMTLLDNHCMGNDELACLILQDNIPFGARASDVMAAFFNDVPPLGHPALNMLKEKGDN